MPPVARPVVRPSWRMLVAVLVALWTAGCGARGMNGIDPEDPGVAAGALAVYVTQQGAAIAGALVQVSDGRGASVGQGQTDESGECILENLAPGQGYVVRAEKAGASGAVEGLRLSGGAEPVRVRVSLSLGQAGNAVLMGRVTDGVAGTPVAGARLVAGAVSALSRPDGTYKLDRLVPGALTLRVEAQGFLPLSRDLALKPGGSQTLDLALDPQAKGPRAGNTVIATPGQLIEVNTTHAPIMKVAGTDFWSAAFVQGRNTVLAADAGHLGGGVVEVEPSGRKAFTFDASKFMLFGRTKAARGAQRLRLGSTLIADTGNDRVIEVDAQDNRIWEFRQGLRAPRWAERLENGNTLIADTGNNRVIEVTPMGDVVFTLGNGSVSVLNRPSHVQFLKTTNTWLVCDAGNNRVLELDRNQRVVWMAGGAMRLADGSGLFNPGSAKRLPGGNTLIADTDANRVIEVSPGLDITWYQSAQTPRFADRL